MIAKTPWLSVDGKRMRAIIDYDIDGFVVKKEWESGYSSDCRLLYSVDMAYSIWQTYFNEYKSDGHGFASYQGE